MTFVNKENGFHVTVNDSEINEKMGTVNYTRKDTGETFFVGKDFFECYFKPLERETPGNTAVEEKVSENKDCISTKKHEPNRKESMIIKGKLAKVDLFLLQLAYDNGHEIEARVYLDHHFSCGSESVTVIGDGFGDWYMLGGYSLNWALISADSFEDAYMIYLEECIPTDNPDSEEELEYGCFDDCGGWYSEITLSYIRDLTKSICEYNWEITIKPGGDNE